MGPFVRNHRLVGAPPALEGGLCRSPGEFQGFGVVRECRGRQLRFGAAPHRRRAGVSRGQSATFGASGYRHKLGISNNYRACEGPAAVCRQFREDLVSIPYSKTRISNESAGAWSKRRQAPSPPRCTSCPCEHESASDWRLLAKTIDPTNVNRTFPHGGFTACPYSCR